MVNFDKGFAVVCFTSGFELKDVDEFKFIENLGRTFKRNDIDFL